MSLIPDEPDVPAEQRTRGRLALRYEDVSQDGRLVMEALPNAVGETWRQLDAKQRASFGAERGAVPILSRMVIEGGEGPVSVMGPHEALGVYQLSHTRTESGEVDRIMLGMWARVASPIGRTQGPPPADRGRIVTSGRIFAEHVFTRPFGPPENRKVRALRVDGREVVPEAVTSFVDPDTTLALPEGAEPLDDGLVPDSAATVFGLDHTDSNQHVNSLVYPRLFIEAALRRFDQHGRARPGLLLRAIEIAYRRPCFAGERARVAVRAFTSSAGLGAVAVLAGDEPAARPRALARMRFAN